MISQTEIPNFKKKFDVVSVFMEHDGEILLLQRQDHKPQGNTWSMLAGKMNEGEDMLEAMVREIKEEINFDVKLEDLKYSGSYFVRFPTYDFMYHVHHLLLKEKPTIDLNLNENKAYTWLKPREALELNLITDEDTSIKWFYNL